MKKYHDDFEITLKEYLKNSEQDMHNTEEETLSEKHEKGFTRRFTRFKSHFSYMEIMKFQAIAPQINNKEKTQN